MNDDMTTKLKEITFLTIKNLKNNEIILPGDYLKVFDQIAKELKLDLQDNLLMEKELSYSTDKINKIVEKTSKNLTQMHSSTKKAQKAILDRIDQLPDPMPAHRFLRQYQGNNGEDKGMKVLLLHWLEIGYAIRQANEN